MLNSFIHILNNHAKLLESIFLLAVVVEKRKFSEWTGERYFFAKMKIILLLCVVKKRKIILISTVRTLSSLDINFSFFSGDALT